VDKARKEISNTKSKLRSLLRKKHKQKRDKRSRGGVNNIHYIYETIELLLIPFYHEIIRKRPKSGPISQHFFIFQQDNTLSYTSKWTLH